jgi:hypothetical protein
MVLHHHYGFSGPIGASWRYILSPVAWVEAVGVHCHAFILPDFILANPAHPSAVVEDRLAALPFAQDR